MTRGSILLLLVLGAVTSAHAKRPPRFVAQLRDGSQVEGDVLANWHAPDALPTLDGRPLLDPANPLLWLRDRQLVAADSCPAFVELFSGDRLPGVALEYRGPTPESPEQSFPHWRVRPAIAQRGPQSLEDPSVRVRASFVRRIVWQRRSSNRYRPGTAFLRDGSLLAFRAARFDGDQALLLLPAGTRRVLLADLAELHLPARDFWQDYLDELAVLCPAPDARLMQLETDDGLVATTSWDRLTVFAWGGAEHWRNWAHGIQPAWSLDVLYVPAANVVMRRVFLPQEVPLSRIPPVELERDAPETVSAWPPQTNRNVQGGPLHSGGRDFGWGFGVHAASCLQFPLTPLATGLRTQLGLDRIVGEGGCIQGRIRAGDSGAPSIFQSDVLVGSARVQNAGRIGLSIAAENPGRLLLTVDPAHDQRPAGADPLDVRDCADWLEPMLELNPETLRDEVRRCLPRQVPAWDGWQAAIGPAATWPSLLREFPNRPAAFLRGISTAREPLLLSRRLKLAATDRWLLLSVGQDRAQQGRPHVQLLLEGELVFDQEIPFSDKWRTEVNPLIVPLDDCLQAGSREVQAEIRQVPGEQETPVVWQGIVTLERLPMIQAIVEDDGPFTALPPEPPLAAASAAEAESAAAPAGPPPLAPATWVTQDQHSGARAVRLPSGPRYRLDFRGSLAIRERPAWGEFRFLRFAFRKPGAGRLFLQLDHRQSLDRPARYDAGSGEPCFPQARRVRDGALPDQWIVIDRDLFQDFGALDLEGITLGAPDGEHVLFDQIYLARTVDDFRHLPARPAADASDQEANQAAVTAVQERVLPSTVAIDFGDGRIGAGTIVSGEGDVLTAGHLVIAPGRSAKLTLADGRVVDAQTRGLCRDLDAGLVKITPPGPYPAVEIENFTQLNAGELYVAATRPPAADASVAPQVAATRLRRTVGQQCWTDFDPAEWTAGGGLWNRYGKLVGVHAGRSRLAGAIYGPLADAQSVLGRLKNGEVWGRWPRGSSPATGLTLTSSPDGLQVLSQAENSPAARAGLQAGDVLVRIDDQPARVPDDLYQAVAGKDPGAGLRVEFRRNGNPQTVSLTLAPRTP